MALVYPRSDVLVATYGAASARTLAMVADLLPPVMTSAEYERVCAALRAREPHEVVEVMAREMAGHPVTETLRRKAKRAAAKAAANKEPVGGRDGR